MINYLLYDIINRPENQLLFFYKAYFRAYAGEIEVGYSRNRKVIQNKSDIRKKEENNNAVFTQGTEIIHIDIG